MRLLRVIIFLFLCFTTVQGYAQETVIISDSTANAPDKNVQLLIADIKLSGNKRTKDFIVMREVPFRKGEQLSVAELEKQLVLTRQQLMNTLLFVDVTAYIASNKANEVQVNIDLKERWYFFPLPYFRLIDRNFNQWWVDQHRSLDRVNYGIKFTQNNTTGRNDELNIWFINGYTQQVTLRYDLPFFDKKLERGFNIGLIHATQKELNYATGDNKQLFFKQETVTKKATRFDLTYSYRPGVKRRHYFRVSYNTETVADTVLKINPLFYPDNKSRISFIDFGYQFKYYNVDYISYPSKGFLFEGNLYKRGLSSDYSLWQASARAVYVVPFTRSSFLHLEGLAIGKLPANDYFYNQRMFGYGYFQMRGLEYNVVDGIAGASLKTTFHKEIFSFILRNPFQSKTHDRIPIRFFLKAYGDLGYAYARTPNITNTLNNTLLRTWGFGMDIVSIYDFVFKIEYSFNQLGRDGLYLQTRNDF
jgi:outer membrane protein assembly factor BamA